ncbi:Spy0128 family protein [Bifidobacterium pseudolongum]|uniref:Spy0128 family protein n=1 Tax=Bifidobacterium pseudolongum TaxID=1694 RepID=UPI00101FEA79|nr:FctA domain-containing protein [Bifidobacterium pseudolongum]RYQ43729.1 VWA domain-containing protein [Bifidobacterium pseudolongum subsp. globosum]
MRGPKRLLARHGAQADEERNGRTPVRKLVATFCAVAMSVGMAGVSMSAYADDQQPAEDATTTVEATPEAQPTEDATVGAQPEAEATDAAEADAQPEAVTADAPTVLAAGDANDTTGGLGDLEHSKTVTKNGDNQYTLNLGVTGKTSSVTETGETPKLDVVLVLDTSGSMADNNRLQTMKDAIIGTGGLSDALFTDKLDTQATIITYASNAQNLGTYSNSQKTAFNEKINGLRADGGTQWDDGLDAATKVTAREGAQKYVVFLTDGDPGQYQGFSGDALTVYNNSVTYGQALVKAGWNILNVGVDMTDNARVNPAVDSVSATCTEYKGIILPVCVTRTGYTTDTRSSHWNEWVSPLEALTAREIAVKTDDQTVRAFPKTDTASLTQVFKDLATIITTTTNKAASSLVITDTISKWVEPVGIKTDAEGNVTQGVTVIRSDNAPVADSSIKSITFKGNTLTVTFADDFVLSNGITYTVQYDIQPSQAAFDYYADKGTYPDTSTTEGAPTSGFFSNDNASFSYKECTTVNNVLQGCEQHEPVYFLHPVIETDFADASIGSLQVKKTVEGSKGWGGNDTFKFTLKADGNAPMPENAQNGAATITLAKPETGNEQTGNFGEITYSQIGTYTYTVTETAGDGSYQYSHAAYKVTVTVTRDATSRSLKAAVAVEQTHGDEANDTTGDPQANKMPMAFVNQNAMVTLDAGTIGVKKTVNGTDTNQGFAFTMTATGNNAGDVKWPNAGQASSTLQITDSFTNGEQKEAKFADALEFKVPSSKTETATYTLQVKEDSADNPPAGWNYDTSVKTVTVTVKYDMTQNKWIATATPTSVEFTNTWVTVSNLPLTGEGGATPMLWLAIGGGLGALALLAAGGAAIWRKRRLI